MGSHPRSAPQPADRPRVSVDWLLAVHPPGGRGGRPPIGPLGRARRRPSAACICERRGNNREHTGTHQGGEPASSGHHRRRTGRGGPGLRPRQHRAVEVPRDLPAGRPRHPPGPDPGKGRARLLVHGPRCGPRWPPRGQPVVGARQGRRVGRRHAAGHDPAGHPVPHGAEGVAAAPDRQPQREPADHAWPPAAMWCATPWRARRRCPTAARRCCGPRSTSWFAVPAPHPGLLGDLGRRRQGRIRRSRLRTITSRSTGPTYLPRKFKIGLAWPGDNCVDVYTQDVGLVPTLSGGASGDLTGWVVLVGGGLGMSHAREDDTYPRLASPLVLGSARTARRGRRGRHHHPARPRQPWRPPSGPVEVSGRRAGACPGSGPRWKSGWVAPWPTRVPLQPWLDSDDHLGWFTTDAGDWALGVPVPSGRVRDHGEVLYRTALRDVFEQGLAKRALLTGRQDVILDGVTDADRGRVESTLSPLRGAAGRDADACRPARGGVPGAAHVRAGVGRGRTGAARHRRRDRRGAGRRGSLAGHAVRVNVTGCPNGCARPYTAEIGIVGRTKRNYDLYVGGSVGGERLAERLRADVPLAEMPALLAPVFASYAADRPAGGDLRRLSAPGWAPPSSRRCCPPPPAGAAPPSRPRTTSDRWRPRPRLRLADRCRSR